MSRCPARQAAVLAIALGVIPLFASASQTYLLSGRIPSREGYGVNGPVTFKFALVTADGQETLWSHDGSSVGGLEPAGNVTLLVEDGRFSVELGDPDLGMIPIPEEGINNPDARIRIWFSVGHYGVYELLQDRKMAGKGVAYMADRARWAETLQGKQPSAFENQGAVAKHEEEFHADELEGVKAAKERVMSGAEAIRSGGRFSVHYHVPEAGAKEIVLFLYGEPHRGPVDLESLRLGQAAIMNQKVDTVEEIVDIKGPGWLAGLRESYEFCNACFKRRMVPRTRVFIDGREYTHWNALAASHDDATPWSKVDNFVPLGLILFRTSLSVTSQQSGVDDALGSTVVWYYTGEGLETSPGGVRALLDREDKTGLLLQEALLQQGAVAKVDGHFSATLVRLPPGQALSGLSFEQASALRPDSFFLDAAEGIDLDFPRARVGNVQAWVGTWEGEIYLEPTSGANALKLFSPAPAILELGTRSGWRRIVSHDAQTPESAGDLPISADGWYPIRVAAWAGATGGTLRIAQVFRAGGEEPLGSEVFRSLHEVGGAGEDSWRLGPVRLASGEDSGVKPGEHALELGCAGPGGGRLSYVLYIR